MSDDTPEKAIERGLEAYFAGETITDLLEGIDVNALVEGAPLDDAVEYEQLGKALGAFVGRTAVNRVSNSGLFGRFLEESFGSEVGGRAGELVTAALVEHGNPGALAEQVRGLSDAGRLDRFTEEVNDTVAGSGIEELGPVDESNWTEIGVENENNE